MRQISLFELEPVDEIDFEATPEEEMVRIVGGATGLNFVYIDELFGWRVKTKKVDFRLKYSRYNTLDERNGVRFISAGYDYHTNGNIGGAGGPCDTDEEAIKFLKTGIERWM